MGIFSDHSRESKDPYCVPSYRVSERWRRLLWNCVWSVLFHPTPRPMHKWRAWLLRRFGARIGHSNFIYPSARIWAPWLLETEDVVTIGGGSEIYNPGGVHLGHHTIISQDAYLCGATHDYNSPNFSLVAKPISTGAYVWICARAIVLPGATCGDGSVLGAGAVASRDLEPWTVYSGNPAVALKKRNKFNVE